MGGAKNFWVAGTLFTVVVLLLWQGEMVESADALYLCMKNCEQCESMYGAYFEGELCAKSCFQRRGSFIPDCIDVASIAPFLNKNEWSMALTLSTWITCWRLADFLFFFLNETLLAYCLPLFVLFVCVFAILNIAICLIFYAIKMPNYVKHRSHCK